MKYIITFLSLLLFGCHNIDKHQIEKVESSTQILKPIILDFFDSVKTKGRSLDFVTLYCRRRNDTVVFNIINSCPDLGVVKYYGYTNIKGHRVFCLGDKIPESFFKIAVKEKIPIDVIKKNRNVYKSSKLVISSEEPLLWSLSYKNKTLINFYPKSSDTLSIP